MLILETVYPLHGQLAGGGGMRQGYSLFLLLYLIYDEAMIREAADNLDTGISSIGDRIHTI